MNFHLSIYDVTLVILHHALSFYLRRQNKSFPILASCKRVERKKKKNEDKK